MAFELKVVRRQTALETNRHPQLMQDLNTRLSLAGQYVSAWKCDIHLFQRATSQPLIEQIYLCEEEGQPTDTIVSVKEG
jgi:hypothetical protein